MSPFVSSLVNAVEPSAFGSHSVVTIGGTLLVLTAINTALSIYRSTRPQPAPDEKYATKTSLTDLGTNLRADIARVERSQERSEHRESSRFDSLEKQIAGVRHEVGQLGKAIAGIEVAVGIEK